MTLLDLVRHLRAVTPTEAASRLGIDCDTAQRQLDALVHHGHIGMTLVPRRGGNRWGKGTQRVYVSLEDNRE